MDIVFELLIPTAVVVGIAAILGFVLSVTADVLADKNRDPRIDRVRKSLCGANCGGCGYAGCDAFAEALVKGEADVSACNPTGAEDKALIAEILGAQLTETKRMVAVVGCSGGAKCLDKLVRQGHPDCHSSASLASGHKACDQACLGLGSCVKACRFGAIKIQDELAVIDPALCTACGACVSTCPHSVISLVPLDCNVFIGCSNHAPAKEVRQYCKAGCIACGKCARECPQGAIQIVDNLAVIDYQKCTGCLTCVASCPVKCIHSIK